MKKNVVCGRADHRDLGEHEAGAATADVFECPHLLGARCERPAIQCGKWTGIAEAQRGRWMRWRQDRAPAPGDWNLACRIRKPERADASQRSHVQKRWMTRSSLRLSKRGACWWTSVVTRVCRTGRASTDGWPNGRSSQRVDRAREAAADPFRVEGPRSRGEMHQRNRQRRSREDQPLSMGCHAHGTEKVQ